MTLESIKKNFKIFWKYSILIFLLSFIIINWVDFSWVFNYKFIAGAASDIFYSVKNENNPNKNKDIIVPPVEAKSKFLDNIQFGVAESKPPKSNSPKTPIPVEIKGNSIKIPKISIFVPLVIAGNSKEEIYIALNKGAAIFPDSVLPGEVGQTIVLGHSSPRNWPKIKYNWIFADLNDLNYGDEVSVYFNDKKYSYYVKEKIFLNRGEDLPAKGSLISPGNVLVLITCWPPGKDYKRIAVVATP